MTLHDDLVAAKALIDSPSKWTKGAFRTSAGCYCAYGAVIYSLPQDDDYSARELDAADTLQAALPSRFSTLSISMFNDRRATTHADIMALFDRAIAAASPNRIVTGSEGGGV